MTLRRRQEISASTCADMGNGYPYCAPVTSDVWNNGSYYEFVWNYNYPAYVNVNALDLHLYYNQNLQMVEVKNWTNIPTSQGQLSVQVDDSWFPSLSYGISKNWTLYGLYVPNGFNASQILTDHYSIYPKQFNFTATQSASPNASSSATPSSAPSLSASSNSSGFPGWGIALIVIVLVAVIITGAVLFWAFCIYRPRQQKQLRDQQQQIHAPPSDHKDTGVNLSQPLHDEKASIYSHTPILKDINGTRSMVSVAGGTSSIFHRPDSPPYPLPSLPSTEAVNLPDTFRYMMQQPDWASLDEENVDEETRRRLGEELLQRQLAEDGTTVKSQQAPVRKTSIASRTPKARTAAIMVADSTASLSQSSSMASIAHHPSPSVSTHPPPRSSTDS